ncbi:putative LRR receptor-like serine/threonine-protein kinase [Cardamine amara subsp. amara]|uniref:LRR receptor-like serine/threonine-protein kinase n=1 Tax=Cardamine amara subsp. amara TaxID=228776 RepID=A0ABD1BVS2_CARAN
MGLGFWCYALFLALFLKPIYCLEPNTDGFFVSEFFKQMGLSSAQAYNFSSPFCSWQGLFCDSKNEHVIVLIASGISLSGSVPDNTIGKLSKLQSLDLSNNKISALPSDFWSLNTLKNLNLSFNKISGSFPSNVGNFGQLESLDISHNNFSGAIPEAVDSLVSLRVLKIDHNEFQMSIPRGLLGCQSLVSIDLSSNQLEGSLPDGFGSAFPKLKSLNLAGNKIHGRDTDFADMESITCLNISGNQFEGSVTGVFKETLEVADLSKNRFQGHIFSQVDSNWFSLIYLDLSENELSGDIFKNLTLLKKLKHLNLAWNRFNRGMFPRIEMLSSLEYLNLSNTNLAGHIPREISELSDLSTLDVSGNHLSGHIPILSIKNLVAIDVSRNNLTGEIPMSILEKLPWMGRFNFSFNNLTFCNGKFSPKTLINSFFGSTSSCPISANPALFKRRGSATGGLKLALAVTLSAMFLLIGALLFVVFSCRRKPKPGEPHDVAFKEEQSISGPFSFQTDSTTWVADVKQANAVPVVIFEKPLLNITFSDLLSATSNFDRDTLLADGKFGPVYRGFLPGGIHVAVKVLVHGSTLSDQEAARELEFLGRIKHPNLVPLTGYCIAGDQRIAIYEYMENGNLQNLLQDLPFGVQTTDDWSTDTWDEETDNGIQNIGPEGPVATWRFRHMIALGTARALAFLHHGCSPPMVHRDVKASSVYLDQNWEPRLSDFGLAKVFGNGLDDEITRGSPGYLPPEFLQPEHELPTPKSDVYCFGVVLFELVTGKKPIEDDYLGEKDTDLVSWVRSLVRKNHGSKAIDPKIQETGSEDQMEEALKIGYLCTADLPSKRPSMQQVVGLLKDIEPKPKPNQ